MDFLYLKSTNQNLLSKSNDLDLLCKDEKTHLFDSGFLKLRPTANVLFDSTHALKMVFSGRIKYDSLNASESLEKFYNDIAQIHWPLDDTIQGYFSGLHVAGDVHTVFTDPIGSFRVYYYCDSETLMVSTNLTSFHSLLDLELNDAALVLEITPSYTQYGRMTVLKGVQRLMPGELMQIEKGVIQSYFDRSIKTADADVGEDFSSELVAFINECNHSFYEEEVVVSLSGGIDSRINLAPLLHNKKKLEAINYGDKKFIDSKIPYRIATRFGFSIRFFDLAPFSFPKKEVMFDLIKETDSMLVNSWNNLVLSDAFDTKLFLIGDVNDILRAKRISTLKSRKFRTRFYLQKFFFGKKLELTPLTLENRDTFKKENIDQIINNAEKAFNYFKYTSAEKERILETIKNDITELFDHIDKYQPEYLESYEELFGLFTEGRLSMGKQLNFLKYKFRPEIPLANIKIIRKVLNVSPKYRYSDELTSKMFRHSSWAKLGRYPTSQNPLIPYNYPYYLVLLGWFLRSKTDHYLMKIHLASKGKFKRKRLFDSYDLQGTYSFKDAYENFSSYFDDCGEFDTTKLKERFKKRRDKKSWPIASLDLMPFVQCVYYIKKFRHN